MMILMTMKSEINCMEISFFLFLVFTSALAEVISLKLSSLASSLRFLKTSKKYSPYPFRGILRERFSP